ncbi:MAG: hypothetical protein SGPRY_004376 [Prymnesium sp.]
MFSAAPPTDRLGFWRGKRVIVAGASSGLGEALAAELASRGASLVIGARRVDKLSDIASLCAGKYECAKPGILELDVTATPAELEAKAAEASAMLGGVVDVFFYCAGRGQRTTALQTSATAHSELMATNFEGAVSLSRAVSLSDALGSFPFLKAAMIGYFDGLRYIDTDHAASAIGSDGNADENAKKGIAPADLAKQVVDAVQEGKSELIASQASVEFFLCPTETTLWTCACKCLAV